MRAPVPFSSPAKSWICSYWLPPTSSSSKKKRFRSYVEISREKCVSAEQLAQIKAITEVERTKLQLLLPTSKKREEARLKRYLTCAHLPAHPPAPPT